MSKEKQPILRPSKSTNAEIEVRVQKVIDMVLDGFSRADIVRYAAKNWKLQSRQVDDYLKAAKEGIKEIAAPEKGEQTQTAIARLNRLYQKCHANGDFRTCLAIQESLSKLLGLNEALKTDITVTNFTLKDAITFE